MDAHVGFVRMNTGVEQSDIGENKGLDFLRPPGTNGPNAYEGGTPLFDLDTYADIGTTDTFMPYYRSDDQYQMRDERQLDQGQPQRPVRHRHLLSGAQPHAAGDQRRRQLRRARRVPLPGRSDADPGRPSGNLYNAFASFLLGVPNRIGRLKLVEPHTTRNWQYSLYVRDQWQASSRMTVSFGTRWEYFPVPTRATAGLWSAIT